MAHLPRLVLGQVWPVTMHKAAQGHSILVWGSYAEGCLTHPKTYHIRCCWAQREE